MLFFLLMEKYSNGELDEISERQRAIAVTTTLSSFVRIDNNTKKILREYLFMNWTVVWC